MLPAYTPRTSKQNSSPYSPTLEMFRRQMAPFRAFSVARYLHKDVIDLPRIFQNSNSDSSIQSMENILSILQIVETQATSPLGIRVRQRASPFLQAIKRLDTNYLNQFTDQFGRELVLFAVLYQFNLKPYLRDNWTQLQEPGAVESSINDIMQATCGKPNSFFARNQEITMDHKLTYLQLVVRYYIMNPDHCLSRLNVDIRNAAKQVLTYGPEHSQYYLPKIKIPPSHAYITHDPLVLRSNIGNEKSDKNLLVYIAMDATTVEGAIIDHHRYLRLQNQPSMDVGAGIFMTMMQNDQQEGKLAFTILCKRVLLKIEEAKEDVGVQATAAEPTQTVPSSRIQLLEPQQYWETGFVRKDAVVAEEGPSNVPGEKSKADVKHVTIKTLTSFQKNQLKKNDVEKVPLRMVEVDYATLSDELLLARLVDDPQSLRILKAIVAYKSRIPDRLLHSKHYRYALGRSEALALQCEGSDEVVIDILENYFDRYFGKFYGRSPVEAEKWLVNLLLAWDGRETLVNGALLKEAVDGLRDIVAGCQLEASQM